MDVDRTGAAKLVALLEALAADGHDGGLTVADLSRALDRDRSLVSRQLPSLVELGLVQRAADGRHRLGWRLFTLATRAGDDRITLTAPPVMRRLVGRLQERVHLSVLQGRDVLTVLSEEPQRSVQSAGWVGRTVPAWCTASGRALLLERSDEEIRAVLDDTSRAGPRAPTDADDLLGRVTAARRRGFAAVVGELDADEAAVAAPVRDFSGRIVAALNISAPAYRLRGRLVPAGREVAAAAAHLTDQLATHTH